MASLRVQTSRESSRQSRPRTRQQTILQKSVEPSSAANRKHSRQKNFMATSPVNHIRGSTIELRSPTFAIDCMSELYELYQRGTCCDVILSTGDCQTSVHKVVLMASSEYFKSLFLGPGSGDDFVVLPSGVCGESLQSLIRFMYTGSLYLNSENIRFMLHAATQLLVKPAIHLCQKFLTETEHLFTVDGISVLASIKVENDLDQPLADVQIKEEFLDDIQNAETLMPDVKVESNKSSSSPEVTQIKTRVKRAKSVTHRARNRSEGEENHLKEKKQRRRSVSSEEEDETYAPPVVKKKRSEYLRRGLSRHCKRSASGTYADRLAVSGTLHQCHICGSGFEEYSQFLSHRKSYHNILPESYTSRLARDLCRRSLRTKLNSPSLASEPSENNISETSHTMKWTCPFCQLQFSRCSECRAHALKVHRPKRKNNILRRTKPNPRCSVPAHVLCFGILKCPSCRRPFLHRENLQTHCVKSHRKMKAVDCGEIRRGRKKGKKSEWRCQQNDCSVVCRSAEQVKRHMATEHPAVLFSCPDCKFMSQVERSFLRHRAQRHGKTMMCHMCGKGCYKLYLLRQHMYVHHKIKDPKLKLFQCSQEGCTYECSSKKRLEDHMRRHYLTKSLSCDVCGKAFKHNIGLQRHKSAIHQGIRPYICDQCGMAFGLEHELKNHIARHSNNKPHACDQCPYRTYDKINLQSHLFSQHNIQTNLKIVIFKCDQCSFTSSRKARLDDHMKKHQNIKDIPCPECGKLFHAKRNLYGHTVKVHRPKTLRCPLCNFSTAIRSKFNEHTRKKHARSPMLSPAKPASEAVVPSFL